MSAVAHDTWHDDRPPPAGALCASRGGSSITLVQPVIWLLLFGALFKSVIEIPGFERRQLHRLPDAGRRRDDGALLAPAGAAWR